MHVSRPAPDVVALADVAEIPRLGFLPVNSNLLYAEQRVLVDTGLPASSPDFLATLWAQIDPLTCAGST